MSSRDGLVFVGTLIIVFVLGLLYMSSTGPGPEQHRMFNPSADLDTSRIDDLR